MTFEEYQQGALVTYTNRSFGVYYPALGLANEVGEVLGHIKKVWRDHGGVLSQERRDKLEKELGDCLWYLAMLCEDLGLTLENVARKNQEKLLDRLARGVIHGEGDNR